MCGRYFPVDKRLCLLIVSLLVSGVLPAQDFRPVKLLPGADSLASASSLWFDADQDSDPDLLNLSILNKPNQLLLKTPEGYINAANTLQKDGGNANGACAADIDLDGDIDLFIYSIFGQKNLLYFQEAKGVYRKEPFSAVSELDNNAFYASFTDYDLDGDPDLLITDTELWNPKGVKRSSKIYINDGKGNFRRDIRTDLSSERSNTRSFVLSDVNGDGLEDLLTINFGSGSELFLKDTSYRYVRVSNTIFSADIQDATDGCSIDWDNDADQDLVICTVRKGLIFYRNDGEGKFTKTVFQPAPGVMYSGLESRDLDFDGRMDLIVHRHGSKEKIYLRNHTESPGWIRFRLRSGRSNFFAVGTKVFVRSAGRWQMQELRAGSAAIQPGIADLHFGISSATFADSVRIVWPDGTGQSCHALAAGEIYFVEQGSLPKKLDRRTLDHRQEPVLKDLQVTIVADTFRIGDISGITIFYTNHGAINADVTIGLQMAVPMKLFNSFPLPATVSGNTIRWTAANVAPGVRGVITLSVQCPVDAGLFLKEQVLEAWIEPFAGDENTGDNRASLKRPFR